MDNKYFNEIIYLMCRNHESVCYNDKKCCDCKRFDFSKESYLIIIKYTNLFIEDNEFNIPFYNYGVLL